MSGITGAQGAVRALVSPTELTCSAITPLPLLSLIVHFHLRWAIVEPLLPGSILRQSTPTCLSYSAGLLRQTSLFFFFGFFWNT